MTDDGHSTSRTGESGDTTGVAVDTDDGRSTTRTGVPGSRNRDLRVLVTGTVLLEDSAIILKVLRYPTELC